jgi:putative redox protein
MGKIKIDYEGNLRTSTVHPETGVVLKTDAPKDNQGKGEEFSPTDLLAVALGSCILTLMGISAKKQGLDLTGLYAEVEKKMVASPKRRIGKIAVSVFCPQKFSAEETKLLETAGRECPVHQSLHSDVEQDIRFHWGHE